MIAAALGVWKFLKGNWTWALPTIGMVAALAWGATAQIGWESCSAAAAKKVAQEQAAVIAQKERDRILGNQIAGQEADTFARIDSQATTAVEKIRYVQVTRDCASSPAMRAADDGLQQLGFSREPRPAVGRDDAQAGRAVARPRRRVGPRAGRRAHPLRRGLSEARSEVRRARLLPPAEAGAVLTERGWP